MAEIDEKGRDSSFGSKAPEKETTTENKAALEDLEPEKTSSEETAGFEPIRPSQKNRRLSIDTISTLRRERSNNGWGVDNLEEGKVGGSIIAPYNLPNPDAPHDPFEVGWDNGDDDELCPRSMPTWRKWVIVGITSVGSFCV